MGLDTIEKIKNAITQGIIGEKADNETVEKRRSICDECPEKKKLKLLGVIETEICGVCKCPIERKTAYKTHVLQKLNPLSNSTSEHTEIVICPLEKW